MSVVLTASSRKGHELSSSRVVRRRAGMAPLRRFAAAWPGLWAAALGVAGCGGTTGREDAPAHISTGVADAAAGVDATVEDLDAGTFDVTITYLDRVLPDVTAPVPVDASDAGVAADWPCPPDLVVGPDDEAGCPEDAGADGACSGTLVAAEYDDAGNVIAAAEGSFCATCAPYNGGAGCTPTEQAFIEHDPSGDCYRCLVENGGLNDLVFPDFGHECSDVTSNVDVSAAQATAYCLNTLHCILGSTPNGPTCATGGQPTFCYCGAGVNQATCSMLTSAAPPNGVCLQPETAGLSLPPVPTVPVLKAFLNSSLGSGIANTFFGVAAANNCTTCF